MRRTGSLRVAIMVFVGSHHPDDVEPVGARVIGGQGREQPRHLDDQLGAAFGEPARVVGGLVVLPGVVGDSQPRMALAAGVVGHPAAGSQVEQLGEGLLTAVAAALPGEQRPDQAGLLRGVAGGVQASPAVVQQGFGHRGQPCGDQRQHEQFVPEHVTAVRPIGPIRPSSAPGQWAALREQGPAELEHV
jgi:hypothetical protein